MMMRFGVGSLLLLMLVSCASQPLRSFREEDFVPAPVPSERGMVSWYGPGFHGKTTASGEKFNSRDLTAAHRTLPFGTIVRVTNNINRRSVIVEINDRGPWTKGRILDVSKTAAEELALIGPGTAPCTVQVLRSK
jgi:rare lipoprotein A